MNVRIMLSFNHIILQKPTSYAILGIFHTPTLAYMTNYSCCVTVAIFKRRSAF